MTEQLLKFNTISKVSLNSTQLLEMIEMSFGERMSVDCNANHSLYSLYSRGALRTETQNDEKPNTNWVYKKLISYTVIVNFGEYFMLTNWCGLWDLEKVFLRDHSQNARYSEPRIQNIVNSLKLIKQFIKLQLLMKRPLF